MEITTFLSERMTTVLYDTLIIGGGIAGLQAAIQLGRYMRKVLVIDAGGGRSALCRSYHNILGWPDGVSGAYLRETGKMQAERTGVQFAQDTIVRAERLSDDSFAVYGTDRPDVPYLGRTLLIATGITDRFPPLPGLIPCLGRTIYVCPDCDGYEVRNRKTAVLGAGNAGASMAVTLTYWTDRIVFVNHERTPVDAHWREQLQHKQIRVVNSAVLSVETEGDGHLTGIRLDSGERIEAERGFIAFGGNEVHSGLARQLGVERLENGHIPTDPRTKMTNIRNVWAAGDIAVHSEQTTVAMGEGILSAIWIHKTLLEQEKRETNRTTQPYSLTTS
jgi:thioredoxin reductase